MAPLSDGRCGQRPASTSPFPGFSTHLSADIDTLNLLAQIPGNADKRLQNRFACWCSMYGMGAHACTRAKTTQEGSETYIKALGVLELVSNKRTVALKQPDEWRQTAAI